MCGRFQLSVKGKEISERFHVEVYNDKFTPRYNCAPSQLLPVITNEEPGVLNYFRWGLIPYWAKDPKIGYKLINTRAETVREKPSFKRAFEYQRCLVPANGFYEWRKTDKQPFRIFIKNEPLFSMAGIWEKWLDVEKRPLYTFSIITTRANRFMKPLHHRMPVILPREVEKEWLTETDLELLSELLMPYNGAKMDAYPISERINSPKNNDETLIYPI